LLNFDHTKIKKRPPYFVVMTRNRVIGIGLIVAGLSMPQPAESLMMGICEEKVNHYAEVSIPTEFYEVKSGDTLGSITEERFGDSSRYMEIANRNESIVDPNMIYAGSEIEVWGPIESERYLISKEGFGPCVFGDERRMTRKVVHPQGTTETDVKRMYR
jgi:hypothetical protein